MSVDENHLKLTDWEWDGLSDGCNLADGHAQMGQSTDYHVNIASLTDTFLLAQRTRQKDTQRSFEKAFFKLAGQHSYAALKPPLYQTACSLSIEVVANYLRQTGKTVALHHPTFDNLADILKRHGVPLIALEEKAILDPEVALQNTKADALFLVCPNNPTGLDITEKQYKKIISFCKKHKKLLIIDSSFRFYSSLTTWDQYAALKASGIDFIVFEDTGKTWPTLELKIGTTVCSDSLYDELEFITNDFLLNVSPFIFTLLTGYIKGERTNKPLQKAKEAIASNKVTLDKALVDLPLQSAAPDSLLSVAWLKLPENWQGTTFCKWLGERNVHVLPGAPFYWNDPQQGEAYIRIALFRPPNEFAVAIRHFSRHVLAYKP